MVSDRYLYWSIEMLLESRNSASSTGSKIVCSLFLEHLLLWGGGGGAEWWVIFFYLVNLKLVWRPIRISNCKEKSVVRTIKDVPNWWFLLSSPLKNDPPETMVSIYIYIYIFLEIGIVKSRILKKICRQLLSTMNVLKQVQSGWILEIQFCLLWKYHDCQHGQNINEWINE